MKQRTEKEKWISEKEGFVKDNKAFIFTEFRGLTVQEMTALRLQLRGVSATAEVVKNRLFKRIMGDSWDSVEPFFKGPTAVVYSDDSAISEVCRILSSFEKENENFKVKGGFLRPERVLSDGEIGQIAKIPDRNTLLAHLVGSLQAPVYGFHRVCKTLLSGIAVALKDYAAKKQ